MLKREGAFSVLVGNQEADTNPVGCNVTCQVLIVVFVGFGCQLGYMIYIRDVPQDQIVCFFEHCSKGGGGVKPMFKKFCCKFGIILEAIWPYKLT